MNDSVVIDGGSGLLKAGFSGEDAPRSVFSSVVGRPKYPSVMVATGARDCYVGHEAQLNRGILSLTYPIDRGVVTSWEDMEQLWGYTFLKELGTSPDLQPVILTEPPLNPRKNRERTAEVMFESFETPALYIATQAVLALYAAGKTTGLVVDSGEGVTHAVPIYQGYSLPRAVVRVDTAGRDVTGYLVQLLKERGFAFNTSAEREIVRDIKERLCYVAGDLQREITSGSVVERSVEMPDGQVISMENERCLAAEALFQPSLLGRQTGGLHEVCWESVMKCAVDMRRDLYSNILLAGGTTKLPGIDLRLRKEVRNIVAPLTRVRVVAPPERKYSVWIGGSILGTLVTFGTRLFIRKQEYEERGSGVMHGRSL